MLNLKITDKDNKILDEIQGDKINFSYNTKYNEGDKIIITSDKEYLTLKLSEKLAESIVYVPGKLFEYKIPYGEKLVAYDAGTWDSDSNKIVAYETAEEDIYKTRNIALNSAALRYEDRYFPYAKANYVTRDEAWFEERNSIDGVICTPGHGPYPFQSYAGGAREDIEYYLYFGQDVEIEKIIFYLRADFKDDHDTYWKSLNIEFDDGEKVPMNFVKGGEPQECVLEIPKTTKSIHLTNFKQAAFPLSWAALTQIEVIGKIIR